jgi:Bacterial type II and III secretion system protein
MKYCSLAFSFWLVAASSAPAQEDVPFDPLGREPTAEMEKQMQIQIEWIELDAAEATKLLMPTDTVKPKLYHSSNAGLLREALQEKIDKNDATLVESTMVTARSGQRARVESIHEFIYPTEYSTGEIVHPTDTSSLQVSPQAMAFETRNVGITLEVDPILGLDERTIDLNIAPELVYLAGMPSWGAHKSDGVKIDVKMPSFYTVKISTQVSAIAGEYVLVAVQTPRDLTTGQAAPDRRLLVFAKVDLTVIGLPIEKR